MRPNIKNNRIKRVSVFALLAIFVIPAFAFLAVTQFKVNKSNVIIEGTSTLHDWSMTSNSANGAAIFVVENGELKEIQGLTFMIPVKTLKSGKSMLDSKAYDELKADKNSNIIFKLTSSKISGSGNKVTVNSTGTLTVAGVTKPINLTSTVQAVSDNEIIASGSTKLKMTDFKMDPPVMMLGQLKTGDEVTIKYNVRFAQ